jgi:nitrate reductase gamma subunit
MSPFEIFWWGALPYIVITMFVLGTVIRRIFFAQTWTSKSSQFMEKKEQRVGIPLFHIAVLFLIFGHIGGLIIPKAIMDAMGVEEHMYHMMAIVIGGTVGVTLIVAFLILAHRRFMSGATKRMKANTSNMDRVLYVLMALTILFGMLATFSNVDGAFNYRTSLSIWFRSIFALQPDVALMQQVPLLYKIHLSFGMLCFAVWPFTRLVHVFSGITAPFRYIGRAAIVYRRRKLDKREAVYERAPEFPKGIVPKL